MPDVSLWALVDDYIADTGATEASIMRRAGLGKGTFTAWKKRGVPGLPSRGDILGLSAALKVDYETVLRALLHDARYLPEAAARDEYEKSERPQRRTTLPDQLERDLLRRRSLNEDKGGGPEPVVADDVEKGEPA